VRSRARVRLNASPVWDAVPLRRKGYTMGQLVVLSATGQGSASLGAFVHVNELATSVVQIATEASVAGASPVRRLRKQAWIALGFTPGTGPMASKTLITWQKFVETEGEDDIQDAAFAVADTVYWDVFPGGEVKIEVDWI